MRLGLTPVGAPSRLALGALALARLVRIVVWLAVVVVRQTEVGAQALDELAGAVIRWSVSLETLADVVQDFELAELGASDRSPRGVVVAVITAQARQVQAGQADPTASEVKGGADRRQHGKCGGGGEAEETRGGRHGGGRGKVKRASKERRWE